MIHVCVSPSTHICVSPIAHITSVVHICASPITHIVHICVSPTTHIYISPITHIRCVVHICVSPCVSPITHMVHICVSPCVPPTTHMVHVCVSPTTHICVSPITQIHRKSSLWKTLFAYKSFLPCRLDGPLFEMRVSCGVPPITQIYVSPILLHTQLLDKACHRYRWVMSRMWMGHVTHVNEVCHA